MKFWLLHLVIILILCSCRNQENERIEIPAPIKNGQEVILYGVFYKLNC